MARYKVTLSDGATDTVSDDDLDFFEANKVDPGIKHMEIIPEPKSAPKKQAIISSADTSMARFIPSPLRSAAAALGPEIKQSMEMLFPDVVKATENGSRAPILAGIRSGLTLPMRTISGFTNALGEGAASHDWSRTAEAFKEGISNPVAAAEKNAPDNKVARFVGTSAAAIANDPLALPMAKYGVGKSLLGTLGRGAGLGLATYGSHAADRFTANRDDVFTGETSGDIVADVLPVAAPVAIAAAAKVPFIRALPDLIAKSYKYIGEPGKEKAYELASSLIKPLPAAKGGQVTEGFQEGIRSSVDLGAGKEPIFPHLFKSSSRNASDIYDNYLALRARIDAGFDPALDALEQSGLTVPPKAISEAVAGHMRNVRVGNAPAAGKVGAMSKAQSDDAVQVVRDLVEKHHGNPEMQDILDVFRAGNPDEFPIPHHYKVRKSDGTVKLMSPAEYSKQYRLDKPTTQAASRTDATAEARQAFRKSGATQEQIDRVAVHPGLEPIYQFPLGVGEGRLQPMERAFEFDPLTPRRAANLKSDAQAEAYRRTAEQNMPREEALAQAGRELKAWLTDPEKARAYEAERIMNPEKYAQYSPEALASAMPTKQLIEARLKAGNLTPDRIVSAATEGRKAAHQAYAKQLENAALIYKLSDALERSSNVGRNKDPLGLTEASMHPLKMLWNPQKAYLAAAQRDPQLAKQIYDYAAKTGSIKDWLTKAGTVQPRTAASGLAGKIRSNLVNKAGIPLHDNVLVPATKAAAKATVRAVEGAAQDIQSAKAALLLDALRTKSDTTKTKSKEKR